MAVRDVGLRDGAERGRERGGVLRAPHGVRDAVLRDEVQQRRRGGFGGDERVDRGFVAVAEEHLPGVRARREDVVRPVVLLVLARLLVAQDRAVRVVRRGAAGDDGRLDVRAHRLAVEVERGLGLADELPAGDERVEVPLGRLVDRGRVGVGALGQVDLGADDVQERERFAGGHAARLRRVHHVVGERGDLRGEAVGGPQGGEREDVHSSSP